MLLKHASNAYTLKQVKQEQTYEVFQTDDNDEDEDEETPIVSMSDIMQEEQGGN